MTISDTLKKYSESESISGFENDIRELMKKDIQNVYLAMKQLFEVLLRLVLDLPAAIQAHHLLKSQIHLLESLMLLV